MLSVHLFLVRDSTGRGVEGDRRVPRGDVDRSRAREDVSGLLVHGGTNLRMPDAAATEPLMLPRRGPVGVALWKY